MDMNPPNGAPASEQLQIIEHVECRLCCQPIDEALPVCVSGRQMLNKLDGIEDERLANVRQALAGATRDCAEL